MLFLTSCLHRCWGHPLRGQHPGPPHHRIRRDHCVYGGRVPIPSFNPAGYIMLWFPFQISWSYGLSACSAILIMISAVLAVFDLRLRPRSMELKVLKFSLSFPRSLSRNTNMDPSSVSNGLDNVNFVEAEIYPVSESPA